MTRNPNRRGLRPCAKCRSVPGMRILRFVGTDRVVRHGRELGAGRVELLEGELLAGLVPTGREVELGAGTRVLAPLEPRAILCIGLNYRDHARETGQALPQRPVLFMKNPAAVQHPGAPILLPPEMVERPEVDFEVELAAVIGRDATRVPAGRALDHVLGYTVANDVSARRLQKGAGQGGGQWVRGKSVDTFCPLGPALVTRDEVPDPQALALETRLNGEVMQRSTTAEMIFSVAELIADLSREMTLLAGTVLLTGTPAGVGFVRQPPRFLVPGDELELTVERLGTLRCPVRARPS